MAKKTKELRPVVRLLSTASHYTYTTQKNRRNDPQRMELKKYDPIVRRHVIFREKK